MDGVILKPNDRICIGPSAVFLFKSKAKEDEASMSDPDAIRLLSEALRLVQSEELKVCTLVFFELELDLNKTLRIHFQRLDAGVVLPDEALQLC